MVYYYIFSYYVSLGQLDLEVYKQTDTEDDDTFEYRVVQWLETTQKKPCSESQKSESVNIIFLVFSMSITSRTIKVVD